MVAPQAIIIAVPSPLGGETDLHSDASSVETAVTSSRKRRWAHLSMEEKLYRKKLKNRVAAQTSRDRKKARMDELDMSVSLLSQEIESLRNQNNALTSENVLLKQQLQDAQATTAALLETLHSEKCSCGKSPKSHDQAVFASLPSNLSRPAESPRHPLLKGSDGKQAAYLTILRILLMGFLLSQNSSQTWETKISQTLATWSDLQKASCKRLMPAKRISQKWNQWWGRHQNSWNPVDQMLPA